MTVKTKYRFLPLEFERLPAREQLRRAKAFERGMRSRRSVRAFSPEPVPIELIEAAVRAAGRAPSGANQQPWRFVVVSDPKTKRRIRKAAESEERKNYEKRFPDEWKRKLEPLGTDWHKPYLETAPYLIAVFRVDYGLVRGRRIKHYYVSESVGIACGFLLAALQWMGLASLTHTPSPMGFLAEILKRPKNERAYLLIPVGFPARGAKVPALRKKNPAEIMTVVD